MASPIGNLIHPPESSSYPLPHSPSHPHHHPYSHPQPQPHSQQTYPPAAPHHPPPAQPPSSLPPLTTTPSPSASGHCNATGPGPPPTSAAPPTPQSTASTTTYSSTPQPPKGHSNTQSLYQCADCLRRYSRPEHLQRHIATHTLGKRFTCDICSKAFSRADLLKRHRTNHQDENGTKRRRITSSPGAGRVARACQACAKARVKCEETKPCTRCKTRGVTCEYATSEDAAMHLLHLSGNVTAPSYASSQASPGSSHTHPPPPPPPSATTAQDQFQPAPPALSVSSHPSNPTSQGVVQSPVLSSNPSEAHLPTPETLMDQSHPDGFHPPYPGTDAVDVSRLPFTDFLRDVLYDQSLSNPAKLAEAQGLAVLDFCDNTNLDLSDVDFGLLDHWNLDGGLQGRDTTVPLNSQLDQANNVNIAAMRSKLVKMWTESPWRWTPNKSDTCYTEQSNLPLPIREITGTGVEESGRTVDRVVAEKLNSSCRDRILGIVLSTCRNNSTMTRVAASFPSTETMDSWIHIFLASHLCSVSSWIHYGSFFMNTKWPEWLAMAASAGALLAPIPALRRFGFALQEAVRVTIPNRFEENNTKIADIGPVQALVMVQDVGLWSGNRRKMEIAECHLTVPIAMMRYRGKFQRSSYPNVTIDPSDEGKVLEEKWRKWYELESWKRLVFHAYLRDAQVSMTQLNNPSMSYAELTLPLPCPKELWFSRTAEEFKIRYLELGAAAATGGKQPPSLGDLLRDINLLSANHQYMDVQYAISIYLHGFWSLIWEYRQLKAVYWPTTPSPPAPFTAGGNSNPDNNPSHVLLNSRCQELCKHLQTFQQVTHDWHEMLSAQESIVLHVLLLNVHVSLDDLQLFSGKEGEEQARRVYPVLQRWSDSYEGRQALWHAGQILRQAKLFPPGHLKDFYAVAVHHAALCIWTHGVVVKAGRSSRGANHGQGQGQNGQQGNPSSSGGYMHQHQHQQRQHRQQDATVVYLDGEDSQLVHRYISFGQGRAAIRGPPPQVQIPQQRHYQHQQTQQPPATECLLEDSQACMEIAQEILRVNFVNSGSGGNSFLPPINENIVLLLRQLAGAAWAVGLG